MRNLRTYAWKTVIIATGAVLSWAASAGAQLLHRYDFATTDDIVGTANGTLVGSATLSNGALVTDGGNGSVSGAWSGTGPRMTLASSAVSGITKAFTIETWFQCTTGWPKFDSLYAFSDGTTANFMLGVPVDGYSPYPSGANMAGAGGATVGVFGIYLDNNVIHQSLVTYDGTNFTYYIDGALANYSGMSPTASDPGFNLSTLHDVGINGGSPWGDPCLTGSTYDFRIYGQALTALQVSQIYALGHGANVSNSQISAIVTPPPVTFFTWDGGGGDNNFGTGLNWVGGTAPATNGDVLIFAGSTDTTPNLETAYNVAGLIFSNNASSFTIGSSGGSALKLTGVPVEVDSANPQTLNLTVADNGVGLVKSGSGTLNLSGNNTFIGQTIVSNGTLNISGSVSTPNVMAGDAAGNSLLGISGTLTINNGLLVGNVSNAEGAVYQTGGTLTANATSGGDSLSIGNVPGAYGYYDAIGGTLTANGIAVGGENGNGASGGNGIMDVNGTVNCTGWFVVARNGNAETGIVNVYNDGSLTYNGGGMVCNWGAGGAGQTTVINVMGGVLTTGNGSEIGFLLGGTGIVNLLGGVTTVGAVNGAWSGTPNGVVNFNGGILQANVNTTNFLALTAAHIYGGGAVVDVDAWPITINQPLLAPSGNGVNTAPVITSGGAGYIAPPIVTVVPGAGDSTGTGATAIAQVDISTGGPTSGQVTNVLITCPGQNYTATPTFVLSGGGAATPAVITGSAPTPNVCGGLVAVDSSGFNQPLTLAAVNTFTGPTIVSNCTLVLAGPASLASSNIIVDAGATLDVSGTTSTYTLDANQTLSGFGNVNGPLNTTTGSQISPGTGGAAGTVTCNNNLTLVAGALCDFKLSNAYNGANDKISVGGTLTVNGNHIHIQAPSTSVNLDTTADYVLITAASISGSFATAPIWDVAPANSAHYTVVTSGATVTLHYNASLTAPTLTASAKPVTLLRNQPVLITANVTVGSAPISTVSADLSALGGSTVLLVESNSSSLYTNTAVVPPTALPGGDMVTVTATDTASSSGSTSFSLTIVAGNDVWNGAGANANWTTGLNWTNGFAPGYIGDSLEFAGSTQLSPNVMNTNYSVSGLTFDANAGAFSISSANGSVLTLSGSGPVVNNSANNQTLNVTIADAGGGLTKSGNGPLSLTASNAFSGPLLVDAGTLNLSGNGSVSNSYMTVGNVAGAATLDISGTATADSANLFVGNASGAVGAVYQTGGVLNLSGGTGDFLNVGNVTGSYGYYAACGGVINVTGISIGGESNPDNWPPQGAGDGIFEVKGAVINNAGWITLARGGGPDTGILNMYSGSLTYGGGGIGCNWQFSGTSQTSIINIMGGSVTSTNEGVYFRVAGDTGILNLNGGLLNGVGVGGSGTVNFNGGTLQAIGTNSSILGVTSAYIYGGGATIDNNNYPVTVPQALLAPAGGGVNTKPAITSGGAGYIAPPIVLVTNGVGDTTGTGATAIAQINPATGTVTNVIVTCPGVNYTAAPVFLVSGGGATTPAVITGVAPTANTSGGLTAIGSGVLTLTGANTYTGNTVISNGTLALGSGGSIADSANISVASAATFDVSAVSFTLGAAQTLLGNGTVNGNVNNNGTIAPGTPGTIGSLTFNNNLTLQAGGVTTVKLNESLAPGVTNDQVWCYGTLTYGGTLAVSNLGGPLHLGDSFQLFYTGGTAGNFAGITGSPGAGLAYSFNPTSGVLSVVAASAVSSLKFTGPPVISGTSLSISATNSGGGTIYLLTSTNLSTPVGLWTPVWTNSLSGSSSFTTNLPNAVSAGAAQQFYILSTNY
jgi:autotransporter-associated beta strand protein